MELRHLHYFIAVAEELHFGRAAARLHMAQPPLSQQIRRLEEDLGVLLLERSQRRQVKLTEAGAAFLREARMVLEQAEHAARAAQKAARGDSGHLSVGFVGSVAFHFFPTLLRAFRRQYPDVELHLVELRTPDQVQALLQDSLQVGLLRSTSEVNGLCLEPLLAEELVAVLPEGHALASRARVDLVDLAREPVVLPPRHSGCGTLHDLIMQACALHGITPRIAQQATELHARIALVAGGMGVTMVPATYQVLQREGVVFRPITDPAPRVDLTLAWRQGDRSPLVQAFLNVAREAAAVHEARRSGNVVSISPKY
ncbi:LysR family transcriptional regulator [Myxococcaceae bacterium JPH2]|nr:LysR family transcriptional regulator [Myxococcaceae bacterium JPH2]